VVGLFPYWAAEPLLGQLPKLGNFFFCPDRPLYGDDSMTAFSRAVIQRRIVELREAIYRLAVAEVPMRDRAVELRSLLAELRELEAMPPNVALSRAHNVIENTRQAIDESKALLKAVGERRF
jgi:hypothetical protein